MSFMWLLILKFVLHITFSITEDSENSIRSSASSQHSNATNNTTAVLQNSTAGPVQTPEHNDLKSLDSMSGGKKSGSSISLSSLSKSFSKKSQVSQFATSVRRKFSENQSKYSMKSVLGLFNYNKIN